MFGTFIGPTVNSVAAPGTWTLQGKRRWALPLVAGACFPPAVPVAAVALLVVVAVVAAIAAITPLQRLRRTKAYSLAAQAAWLFVAVAGLRALIIDIQQITSSL